MAGQATDAQIAGFLTALRMKGETATELVGFARVMREKAEPFWDGEVRAGAGHVRHRAAIVRARSIFPRRPRLSPPAPESASRSTATGRPAAGAEART